MRKTPAINIAVLILTVFIVVTIIYYRPLTTCNNSNCIILGSDTLTQIHNYVKLKIPELWIPTVNYGISPINPIPGVIAYALLIKTLWHFTNANMILTLYFLVVSLLALGSIGLYVFIKEISLSKTSNILLASFTSVLMFTLNPGLWTNLYHGLIGYLMSYSICPWLLVLTRRIIFDAIECRKFMIIVKNVVLLIAVLLISMIHPISSSLLLLIILSYAILLAVQKIKFNLSTRFYLIVLRLALVLVLSLALLTPFVLLVQQYVFENSPSPSYVTLIAETHRNVKDVIAWHAILPLYSLSFNDNTVLQLGYYSIVCTLIFAVVILITVLYLRERTAYRVETTTWLLLLLGFLSLSMGSKAPWPFNILNELFYHYIPLVRVVGAPFRFAMISGFCMSVIIGMVVLMYANSRETPKRSSYLAKNKSNKLRTKIYIVLTLVLIFASIFSLHISSLVLATQLPESYNKLVSYIANEKSYENVYVIPSSEWVVPYKLLNVSEVIRTFKGATVLPWPHNILGIILSLHDVPETLGSYLRPYFEYVVRYNLTDLLSMLMYYMGIKYIAIDGYVKPTTPWLRAEATVLTRQVGVEPIAQFGDVKLYKVLINGSSVQGHGFMRIYNRYGIVAANILKFLPLSLIDNATLGVYPIIVDEVSLPYISKLLSHAYYVLMDRAGFYDLILSELIHMPNTKLINPFQLNNLGKCTGICSIEAIRVGWGYSGKPYYSIFDGDLLVRKGSKFSLSIDLNEKGDYVVLIRVLVRGEAGYIIVNNISKKIGYKVDIPDVYEPIWLQFKVNDTNKLHINVIALNNLYIDCIVITPYRDYLDAVDAVIHKLQNTKVFFVITPYDLTSSNVKHVDLLGLGLLAQGDITLRNFWKNLGLNISSVYVISPSNSIILIPDKYMRLSSEYTLFSRYSVAKYDLLNNSVGNIVLITPYAKPLISYKFLENNLLELKGFGSYLWFLPPTLLHNYNFMVLNFRVDVSKYTKGDAFGVALFHNSTYGYEIKFELVHKDRSVEAYHVSVIKRIKGAPIFLKSNNILLPAEEPHNITVYINLDNLFVLVSIDDKPCIAFKVAHVYGYMFGIVQWGRNADMIIQDAYTTLSNNVSIIYKLHNVTLTGYGSKLIPTIAGTRQDINISIKLRTLTSGRYSAFGLALFHNGISGLELKIPIEKNGTICRIELWKRINRKAELVKSIALKNPIRAGAEEVSLNITIAKLQDSINLTITIGNNALELNELKIPKQAGAYLGLISWGKKTNIIVSEYIIHAKMLGSILNNRFKTYIINLLDVKLSNGIVLIMLEAKPKLKWLASTDVYSTVVYLQSYRPAWNIEIRSCQPELIYHLRGMYGIANVYVVKFLKTCEAINVYFFLSSSHYIILEVSIYVTYIVLYFLLLISKKVKSLW